MPWFGEVAGVEEIWRHSFHSLGINPSHQIFHVDADASLSGIPCTQGHQEDAPHPLSVYTDASMGWPRLEVYCYAVALR